MTELTEPGHDPSPTPVDPKMLGSVHSVRLPFGLAATLRDIANRRDITISDLFREGVGYVLCAEGVCSCPSCPRRAKTTPRDDGDSS
jgi:hypothetical protein